MEPSHHDATVAARPSPRSAAPARRGRGQVRAIARAAGRTCTRPSCDTPAAATLVFSYQERVARLVDLLEQVEPQTYDLCPAHAERTNPPVGWELSDTRPPPSDAPRRLEDEETVEVLAAVLRGETPRTRVSVVEGGREDMDEDEPERTAAAVTVEVEPEVDEDPLRAALEELQRIATPEDEAARLATPATPLRPRTPTPPPPSELPDPVGPPPPPPADATGPAPGDLTLW